MSVFLYVIMSSVLVTHHFLNESVKEVKLLAIVTQANVQLYEASLLQSLLQECSQTHLTYHPTHSSTQLSFGSWDLKDTGTHFVHFVAGALDIHMNTSNSKCVPTATWF